jgi:hypothetical protein
MVVRAQVTHAERRAKVIALRKQRFSYARICVETGFSRYQAYRIVHRAKNPVKTDRKRCPTGELTERNTNLIAMRNTGVSWRLVGLAFGVSLQRAQYIYAASNHGKLDIRTSRSRVNCEDYVSPIARQFLYGPPPTL